DYYCLSFDNSLNAYLF
nr:immunoglobulin light chain junction region [Macaca mulatta]MOW66971.1 immunoglobulin light chain junction region [Macaca mulatta]MOW67272.1 immunoglobulin light chain junction region [Macaca mulatta]MOW67858.1 immunoglobulin light chain junction region [Macaca mulatta]MOW68106.1 immunoglobulin light chain junction region [Macaca mulatta]